MSEASDERAGSLGAPQDRGDLDRADGVDRADPFGHIGVQANPVGAMAEVTGFAAPC